MREPHADRDVPRGAEQAVDELVGRGKIDPPGVPPPAERARRAALGLHPVAVRARGRKLELRHPTSTAAVAVAAGRPDTPAEEQRTHLACAAVNIELALGMLPAGADGDAAVRLRAALAAVWRAARVGPGV